MIDFFNRTTAFFPDGMGRFDQNPFLLHFIFGRHFNQTLGFRFDQDLFFNPLIPGGDDLNPL